MSRFSALPPGFVLQTEFLQEREEHELIEFIRNLPFGEVRMHGVTAKRRVAQFGWRYAFETFRLSPAEPIPPEFAEIRERTAALANVSACEFSEALVTEYPPSAGIGWHRDAPAFAIVAGISLGAECRMRFQRGSGEDRMTTAVVLPRRSVYLLTGEARTVWQHMIPGVKAQRWSITFRTLRRRGSDSALVPGS